MAARSRWALAAEEARKLPAFARRDLLIKLSYGAAFLSDVTSLVMQSLLFYFVGKLVDNSKIPGTAGQENPYIAFVCVGITISAFMALALGRLVAAIEREHLIGTLESLLVTPTSFSTLQLGSIAYDVMYVPVRAGLFLGLVAVLYDVHLTLSGLPAALLVLLVFMPFVWGIGVALAAAVLTFRRGGGLVGGVSSVLALVSGAYFPTGLLPGWLGPAVTYNPVRLALEDLRAALLQGAGVGDVAGDCVIIGAAASVSLGLGVVLFRAAVSRERRNGTIGVY